jgi:hypothetical protein
MTDSENNIVPASPGDGEGSSKRNKWVRGAINAAGGAIPFAGGFLSAAAGVWGESEAEKAMAAVRAWIKMLEDEVREKQRTIIDILSRLDMHEEKIGERVKSSEYQSLLKKAFRNWAGTESERKQIYVRNILTNAASTELVSDDVVSLFLEWLHNYSEFHFAVIGELYRNPGSTRGDVWRNLGKKSVREDSADADLFKLLVRDLSTGGIIRQHRETDYNGNFVVRRPSPKPKSDWPKLETKTAKSAFDNGESYELTALGSQFVHYAMTEITVKLEYRSEEDSSTASAEPSV